MAEEVQTTVTEVVSPEAPLTEDQILDQIELQIEQERTSANSSDAEESDSEADNSAQDQASGPADGEGQESASEADGDSALGTSAGTDAGPKTLTLTEHEERMAQSKTDQQANIVKQVEEAVLKARAEERATARQAEEKATYDALPEPAKAQRVIKERGDAAIVEAAKPRLFREWGAQMGQTLSASMMETFGFDTDPNQWSDAMKADYAKHQTDFRTGNDGNDPGFVDNVNFLMSQYGAAKEAEFESRLATERKKWKGAADESAGAETADSESEPPAVGSETAGVNGHGLPPTLTLTEDLYAATLHPSPALTAHYRKLMVESGQPV